MSVVDVAPTTVTWRDCRGYTGRITYYINFADVSDRYAHAEAVFGTLINLSNASIMSALGAYTLPPLPLGYGSTTDYASVYDKAEFVFTTVTGAQWRTLIPAPSLGLFLADGVTLDASDTNVANFVDTLLTSRACNRSGDMLAQFIGGTLKRDRRPRKFGLYRRSPDLTGSDW